MRRSSVSKECEYPGVIAGRRGCSRVWLWGCTTREFALGNTKFAPWQYEESARTRDRHIPTPTPSMLPLQRHDIAHDIIHFVRLDYQVRHGRMWRFQENPQRIFGEGRFVRHVGETRHRDIGRFFAALHAVALRAPLLSQNLSC